MADRTFTPPVAVPVSIEPIIEGFLDWGRVEKNFAAQTISMYKRLIRRFVSETNVQSVESISQADVLRLKRSLMNRGCSPSYIATMVLSVRSLLIYCRDLLKLDVLDPATVIPPKRPRKPVVYLGPDEVEHFVKSIKLENRWAGRRRIRNVYRPGMFFRALVEVLLGTGMRISEALAVRKKDIDWVKQEARVLGKGNKYRTVFFTKRSLEWLKKYLDLRTDANLFVFVTDSGEPMTREMVVNYFRRQSQKAGLNKTVTAHMLRHTVATTLMFNGCPMGHIKEILGHERLDTTCRYYLGLDQREARKAHEKYLQYGKRDEQNALPHSVRQHSHLSMRTEQHALHGNVPQDAGPCAHPLENE